MKKVKIKPTKKVLVRQYGPSRGKEIFYDRTKLEEPAVKPVKRSAKRYTRKMPKLTFK